ncbi:hypothetical protein BC826DRAFT_970425 [Russula brevipes]|nr:hypothetical protein BC826DRAFT_970425 [Russula brevipes]
MGIIVTHLIAGDTVGTNTHDARQQTSSIGGATANQPPLLCPGCKEQVGYRPQELNRHILSMHLPCWIFCPYPSCTWRGTRPQELERHLETEKCGPKPEREQYQIYDTKLILGWILEDGTPVEVAARYALDFVGERAIELGKEEAWSDLWGNRSRGKRLDVQPQQDLMLTRIERRENATYPLPTKTGCQGAWGRISVASGKERAVM